MPTKCKRTHQKQRRWIQAGEPILHRSVNLSHSLLVILDPIPMRCVIIFSIAIQKFFFSKTCQHSQYKSVPKKFLFFSSEFIFSLTETFGHFSALFHIDRQFLSKSHQWSVMEFELRVLHMLYSPTIYFRFRLLSFQQLVCFERNFGWCPRSGEERVKRKYVRFRPGTAGSRSFIEMSTWVAAFWFFCFQFKWCASSSLSFHF